MNREPIRKYLDNPDDDKFCQFFVIPARVAARLPKRYGYVKPNDRQNDSPTAAEMIGITIKYNGWLEGYVIPFASGRCDARITFSGFTILVSKETAFEMKEKLDPSEFEETSHGYRFWWD